MTKDETTGIHATLGTEVRQNKFRNPSGARLTRALFHELTNQDSYTLYTLKDIDWKGYPSIFRLYMELGDLTEYVFANTYFESWDHWLQISSMKDFLPFVTRWREELKLKTTSEVLKEIKKEASKGSFQANKILLDYAERLENTSTGGAPLSKKPPRGRPSAIELKNNLRQAMEDEKRHENDLLRLMGT